jgi:hypothetical protein
VSITAKCVIFIGLVVIYPNYCNLIDYELFRIEIGIVVWTVYNLFSLYLQWEKKMHMVYTQKDIDQVRAEWAKYVVKFQDS